MPPDCDFRTTVLPQIRLMRSLKGMHLGCSLSCRCSKASNSSIGGRRPHKSPRSLPRYQRPCCSAHCRRCLLHCIEHRRMESCGEEAELGCGRRAPR